MNILIVKLSAIGDVIHTLPALNALRRHFPQARITWLVEEAAAGLIMGHPALDRVIVSRRKTWLKGLRTGRRREYPGEMRSFVRLLRDTHYDVILDFQALLKSALLIALCRGTRKIGFGRGMAHMEHSYVFLNERIPAVSMEIHALVRNLMMLEPLGIRSREIVYDLPVSRQDRRAAQALLDGCGLGKTTPLVAVNPVAKWPSKLWGNRKFSRLADRMVEKNGAGLYFTGGPEDRPTVDAIIGGMRHPAVNLAGKTTLKTLAALYRRSDLLVSTDTGPMHLGAAVGTPVVAIFGPTAPWRTGPYGTGHRVIRHDSACSPCFKRVCEKMDCMDRITVEQVFQAVDTAWR